MFKVNKIHIKKPKWIEGRERKVGSLLGLFIFFLLSILVYILIMPKTVEVEVVSFRSMPLIYEGDVNVTALHKEVVKAPVSAKIEAFLVKKGDYVKKGQALARLDLSSLEEQLSRLKEQDRPKPIVSDTAALGEANRLLANGLITKKEYEGLVRKYEVTPPTSSLSNGVQHMEMMLAHREIRSPMDGLVTAIYNEDRMVAVADRPLFLIQEKEPLEGRVVLPKEILPYFIKEGVNARITANSKGTLVEGQFDPKGDINGSYAILFPNQEGLLMAGDFYPVKIESKGSYEVLTIPEEALHESSEGSLVYVVTKEGTVDIRLVTHGPLHEGYYPIYEGLEEGEKVIVSGSSFTLGEKIAYQG